VTECCGEGCGDDVAMIDRFVHHADVIDLKATATDSNTETSAAGYARALSGKCVRHRATNPAP